MAVSQSQDASRLFFPAEEDVHRRRLCQLIVYTLRSALVSCVVRVRNPETKPDLSRLFFARFSQNLVMTLGARFDTGCLVFDEGNAASTTDGLQVRTSLYLPYRAGGVDGDAVTHTLVKQAVRTKGTEICACAWHAADLETDHVSDVSR